MIQTLQQVLERALDRLSAQIVAYVPPLLVALTILIVTLFLAWLVRLVFARIFKGVSADRFVRESGFSSFLPGSGPISVAPLLANAVYWLIVLLGMLTAVNVFDTKLSSQIVEGTVFLFPKLITAGAILLVGFWLAQFLGRSILIWASNEGIPHPRRISAGLRVAVVFVSVVVAADILDFAGRVFFAAFVIFVGGAVLACSLALGLGSKDAVVRWLQRRDQPAEESSSIFNHV